MYIVIGSISYIFVLLSSHCLTILLLAIIIWKKKPYVIYESIPMIVVYAMIQLIRLIHDDDDA